MQHKITDNVKIENSAMPFQSFGEPPAVGKAASNFNNATLKVKKIRRLTEQGIYNADIPHYIPGILDFVFQGKIEKIMTIEQPADTTYFDKEILDFELILENNFRKPKKSLLMFSNKF